MLAKTYQTFAGVPQNLPSAMVDVLDRLDDAKALTQALLMAADGATGCDEVEINAISRLAWKISEDIKRARAIVEQATGGMVQ